ncbi:MAG: glycosyltransferase family 4 protein [Victivallales bacterium]|nr:glycosyltransferase family 4 protein [Victivallales bacterium]
MKSKRILYLFASYPRWSEGFLRQDLGGLLASGMQIVATSLFPGDCQIQPGWPVVTCLTAGEGGDASSGTGLSYLVPRPLRAPLTMMRHRSLFKKLLQLCKEEHISHIHGEFADIAGLFAAKAAANLGCTFSLGLHADDCLKMKYSPASLFENASFVTICNENARNMLLEKGCINAERLHLLRHGVELRFWSFMENRHTSSEIDILFAGRLVPKKGLDLLLEALSMLPGNYTLKVAGSGPEEALLRKMAQNLGVSGRVTWLGWLGQEALRTVFATSSCLCVPSVEGRGGIDGVPNVMLEAMASGLPVVAFGKGGIGEALDAEKGFLVDECTADGLCGALRFLEGNASEVEKRRCAARARIEQDFDAARLAKERAALFEEI